MNKRVIEHLTIFNFYGVMSHIILKTNNSLQLYIQCNSYLTFYFPHTFLKIAKHLN